MNKLLYLALCLTLLLYGFAVKSQVSLINENFNGTGLPPGWTVINNSSGGIAGPGEAKWTLRPDGYQYGSQYIDPPIIFHSNDFSQFYLSNSDAQGDPPPAPTTNTILQLPVINTIGYSAITMQFYHNFLTGGINDYAHVEVSTDGYNWTWVYEEHFTDYMQIGFPDAFVLKTINLNPSINVQTLYIRFHYEATFGYYWALDNVTVTGTPNNFCSINNWEGTVSTAWENPANWSCGSIPTAGSTVNIYPGKPRYPVVNSIATCKTLNSFSGTSVIISSGYQLVITGP